ncbi:MAG: flippase-like domain-containing protein [Tannerellaceae bacterium]|jgi:uncharacterized protein (TIRG00374 family)|nr:flippase-like domain-containing protein [Tannerellaceae bacterium]
MSYKKILNTAIKVILPLFLGCGLLWYLYRGADLSQMWAHAKKASLGILLFSLLFGLAGNLVRSFRWGLLIDAIGEKYRIRNLICAVLGNYAINFVLPRVGEVWRCGIITRYEKISFTKLLGTLVIDRVADTLSVGIITLLIFFFNLSFVETYLSRNPSFKISLDNQSSTIWIIVALLIIAAATWFTFTRLSHLSLVQKARGGLVNIWEGMKSVWLMERKWLFLLQTLGIWSLYFLFFYTTFYAFDFTRNLGPVKGLIVFTMSSIGVAAPVQGGIGAWHFMVISSLVCFDVPAEEAAAFALVVYTIQSVWQIVCGLVGIVALPMMNKEEKLQE